MDSRERHRRASEIYADAVTLPPDERAAHVERACAGDAELLAELRSLLAADEKVSPLLDRTAPGDGAEVAPPEHPEAIGPYRILGVLGEGGMGVVYEAEQSEPLKRRVALKVIRLGMDSRAVVARFEAERQALARMEHGGIARVYDAGVSERGRPWFAMEFVDGVPITTYCREKRLDLAARLALFAQVCDAVQHAHQKGVIHRDLKPGNVLVTEVDDRPVPKVIDFGIAKAVGERLTDLTLHTQHGLMIGTPGYMAPEQTRVEQDADTRADVYSLGVILYELLAGRLPFEAEELRAAGLEGIHRIIREVEPPRPSRAVHMPSSENADKSVARRLRGDLDWIVMRCLEKERDRRYGSPQDLARDVTRYLNDEPVDAGPPTARYKVGKFVRRHRLGVGLTAAAAAATIGVTVALAVLLGQAREARAEAEEQAAIATAANDFLRDDLLAAADPARLGREVTVAEVLDLASGNADDRFADQPAVAASVRVTLGTTYRALGQFDEALEEFERALKIAEREFGPSDPRTIDLLHEISITYADRGEFIEAEAAYERAIASAERSLGPDNATTLNMRGNLALLYLESRRWDEAEELNLDVLAARRRTLPADDPQLLKSLNNLGLLYQSTGDLAEAEPYLEEAVALSRVIHGPRHPDSLRMKETLSWLHMGQDEPAEAERLLRQLHETRLDVFGPNHPDTVSGMHSLGESLRRQGKFAEAVELLAVAESAAHRAWPADGWIISAVQALYGDVLSEIGRFDEAERVLIDGFERIRRTLGPDSGLGQTIVGELVNLHERSGRPDLAAEWRERLTVPDPPAGPAP